LVFFSRRVGGSIGHVGIYMGKGLFVHASPRAGEVRTDRLDNDYFRRRFVEARRILESP